MSILGLSDPWVIGAYVGCFLCVAFCIYYSLRSNKDEDSEEGSDD